MPARSPAAAATAALVAALALVAGCTAPAGDSGQSTSAGVPDEATSHTSAPAMPTGRTSPGGAGTGMTLSSAQPETTPATTSPAASGLPGGAGDRAALAAAGDLGDDGRIALYGRDTSEAEGSTETGDSADLCAFLFGTPAEIAEIARLADDLALDPISGRHDAVAEADSADGAATDPAGDADSDGPDPAAGATVIACVYQAGDTPMLALQVGDGPPIDPDLPGRPIIVDADGLHAVLSYSPDHIGPVIDPAKARNWLTEALGRVAPTDTGTG